MKILNKVYTREGPGTWIIVGSGARQVGTEVGACLGCTSVADIGGD